MKLYRKINDNPSIVWVNEEVVTQRIDADYYHVSHIQKKKSDILMTKLSGYCTLSKKRFNFSKYDKEKFKYIDISNVNINTGDFEYQTLNINNAPSRARKKVNKNDIIVSTVRPNRNAVSIINVEDNELVASTGFAVLECKRNIDNYYLFTVLKTDNAVGQLVRKTSGGLYPAISEQDILDIDIPIPSPEIQKYIGDKVRKAEGLREAAKGLKKEAEEVLGEQLNVKELLFKLNKYTEKYNWIKESDINDRMDALYYNPQKNVIKRFYKNYDLRKLNELVGYKKGFAFKSRDYCHSNTNTFLLRVSDISNDEVSMENMVNLPEKFYQEYIDFNLFNQDIVMVVTGNTTGKSIIINNSESKLLLNQNAVRMRLKDGVDVSSYYIDLILKSQYFQTLLRYSLYQSVQPFISMEFLNEVMIPIIDKTEREEISNLYKKSLNNLFHAKKLIFEAKQDVEDLIEGNFDVSKVKVNN
ncbi:restriction endonuclease subunit S [Clostridium tepidum]|uniref:restriction endonuclease subunit S n=1 Tax=Clostridium tepidum TaxID=1962263 RepID=UPI0018AAD93D|nr:restriction endonuclease subunit S [Clostridium tepidum]